MFRARDVIIVAGLMLVLSVILSILSLLKPPDGDGWNADSYGTRARGHRALYELLAELKAPVSRQLTPPVELTAGDRLLVMWGPDTTFIEMEPGYLYRLREWMKAGGEIVIAPPSGVSRISEYKMGKNPLAKPVNITDALGVPGVHLTTVNLAKKSKPDELPVPKTAGKPAKSNEDDEDDNVTDEEEDEEVEEEEDEDEDAYEDYYRHEIFDRYARIQKPRALKSVPVSATGDLAAAAAGVQNLSVPSGIVAVIDDQSTATASGMLRITSEHQYTVAATYAVGAGRLTVISDPSLFMNEALAKDDNAVLAAHLLAAPGRQIVFDEFYHGLTVRGNPLWLVTQFPYGLLALLTIAWVSLWAWRAAIHLGPPLPETTVARRSVADYVDAMSRLFLRAGSHKFLMRELRDGALWMLRHQLNLPPGIEGSDRVIAALQRRDPRRAEKLSAALNAVDIIILSDRKPSIRELIIAAGKVNACL